MCKMRNHFTLSANSSFRIDTVLLLILIEPCGFRLDPGGSFPGAAQKPSASHF